MRPRTLLILAIVVGALLALIYFAEDKVASTDERAAAAKRLIDAEPDEIVALEILWQGERVRFERAAASRETEKSKPGASAVAADGAAQPPAPGPWSIVAPIAHRADEAAVGRLLTALTGLEAVRDLDGAARGDVGLDPPRGMVTWSSAAGEGRLEIGGAVPATRDIVVAASGRRALAVTGDGILADLARPAGEWRSREVVTASRERIERISLSGPGGASPTVLVQSGATLRLERPVADAVDRDLADRLLTDLGALRMETFVDAPIPSEVERALAAPAGVVELTIAGEPAPLRIEIGGETATGKRLWRAGDQVFESASALAAAVARPASEWRSRSWTRFENWRIEKARIEAAGGSFDLSRSDGEWLRDGRKIPFAAASDLLQTLTAAKAERLVEGAEPDTSAMPPRLTVTLSDADGNEERLTLLATPKPAATTIPARTGGRDVTLLLAQGLVADLEAKISAARAAAAVADGVPPAGAQPAPPAP